jgi:bifunctional non-homologous end joining protein LigD
MASPPSSTDDPLARYREKRDFAITPEPGPIAAAPAKQLSYVIQKHAATRLHYDFRLELDGVLLSWAVPKGPSFDPADKRMAVHVEDHPVSYGSFEGTIPPKQYGAGTVIVWDRGTWEPVGDPREGMAKGKLVLRLHGEKLAGLWELIRIKKPNERQDPWLLFKKKDEWARPRAEYDVVTALPDSVVAKPLGLLESREPRVPPSAAAGPLPVATGLAPGPARGRASAARTGADREEAAEPVGAPAKRPRRAARTAARGNGGAAQERADVAALPGAAEAALPATLSPQLATLARTAPNAGEWIYEIKFDGYRVMTRIEGGAARMITRGGHDWTAKMQSLAAGIESLGIESGWLDGEIVVLNGAGVPEFNALQNAFDASRTEQIRYFLFDAPFLDGYDLRAVPLQQRRAWLKRLIEARGSERVRFSEDFPADAASVMQTACRLHLEGIIAKRKDAPYVSLRTETWLKLKCGQRQEFVIGGFIPRTGMKGEIGSLLLGVYDDRGRLVYSGNVGTGWDAEAARALYQALAAIETASNPFDVGDPKQPGRWSRRTNVEERWVKPQLVAEVNFTEWTPDHHVRHASFQGLRADKPAREVVREGPSGIAVSAHDAAVQTEAVAKTAAETLPERAAGAGPVPGVRGGPSTPTARRSRSRPNAEAAAPRRGVATKVSNPERVIDASTGLKKLDLVRYYESVADWILPHLKGRPVSLVRGPDRGRRRALLPEARRQAGHPRHPRARPGALAGPSGSARDRDRRGARGRGADERHRAPHLELDDALDRQARPGDLRPRSRRGRRLAAAPGGGDADANDAHGARSRELAQDQRRQGPACGRAAGAAVRLRRGQGLLQGGRRAPGEDHPLALRRQERGLEPCRPDLRRLLAQRPWGDDRRCVLGALAPGARRLDAGFLGAAAGPQGRGAMDDFDCPRIPVVPDDRPLGGLRFGPADPRCSDEAPRLSAGAGQGRDLNQGSRSSPQPWGPGRRSEHRLLVLTSAVPM